jgi:RNA polymerase sigma-70 factor (ECF subfamily)
MTNTERPHSESKLISAAKKDRRAFAALYDKYYEQIFLFVYKRMESQESCGDVCSQVFLKAMTHLHQYEDRGFPFSSWLYRIAINEVNQYFRNNKKAIRAVSIDHAQVQFIADEMGDGVEVERALQALEAVLDDLDEPSLTLIEMRFFDQKSFKEMGQILGISEGNAKIKTYRVLEKLKIELLK